MMTAEEKYRLRKSFATVERQPRVAALIFYQHLFTLDPTLRPLFKSDIETQAMKLMEMLAVSLSLLERPDELTKELEELGARHVFYGVKDKHYAIGGEALLAMLAAVLGPDFNAETRKAWSDLYEVIATTMMRGAALVVLDEQR